MGNMSRMTFASHQFLEGPDMLRPTLVLCTARLNKLRRTGFYTAKATLEQFEGQRDHSADSCDKRFLNPKTLACT